MKVDLGKNGNKSIYSEKNSEGKQESNRKEKLIDNSSKELDSLVIIDSSVKDYQQLLQGVKQGVKGLILSPQIDAVTQITAILAQRPQITTLHLVSHGSPGCLYLGNSQLNLETLDNYQRQLKQWKVKHILLYGCNVAATQSGQELLSQLHQLTGATISASAKPTGNADLGGDWQLEVTLAAQTSPLPLFPEGVFRSEVLREYQAVLAATLVGVWDRLSSFNDVAITGNYAYAVGDGLEVIDISNPTNPIFKTFSNIISNANAITVVGNTAYVADGDAGLRIINLSNPTGPTLWGTYDTPGEASDVTVIEDTAYVADESAGLQIIDISDPTRPDFLGSYDTHGFAYDVAVVGNIAYVADGDGLQIINISNPSQSALLGTYDTPNGAYNLTVAGHTAYLVDIFAGLQIIDISNLAQPLPINTYNNDGARTVNDVIVVGNTAYLILSNYSSYSPSDGSRGELRIIDISNAAQPEFLGTYNTPGYPNDVTIVGNTTYIAEGFVGLEIIDTSNSAQPVLLNTYNNFGFPQDVTIVGNTAYLVAGGDLEILNISNPAQPEFLGTYDTPGEVRSVTVVGNTAYVADGNAGLQIFDISNQIQPMLLGSYDIPESVSDVTVVGNTAYVVYDVLFYSRPFLTIYSDQLQAIDISNPTQPLLLGTYNFSFSSSPLYIKVVDNTAYVSDIEKLQIFDINNPAQPVLLGTYNTNTYVYDVKVVGNTAFLAAGDAGLQIIDISNPAQPVLLGAYDTPMFAGDVTIVSNTAFLTDRSGGVDESGTLQIIDISNPAQPALLGTYNTSGNPEDVTVEGNYAYLASRNAGLEIIDVSEFINNTNPNPDNPNNPDTLLNSPVYRFYNPFSRGHFFTTNSVERDSILARPELGYQFEGTGFNAATTEGDNLLPVFRFYNPLSRGHFFTTNTAERDNVIARPELGYQFEGTGFYAYSAEANLGNDIFRFYNSSSAGHFFTANPVERDNVIAHPDWGYTFEGVGFEAA